MVRDKHIDNLRAFIDADDWWYPTKLEEQIKFMEENHYPFTGTWYEDDNEKLEPYYTMKQDEKQTYKSMVSGCNIGTPGVMIDTKVLGKKYMPALRRAEDWGLWMMYLRKTEYLVTYPKALWKYRHIPGSETSNKWKQMKAVVAIMYQQVLVYECASFVIVPLFKGSGMKTKTIEAMSYGKTIFGTDECFQGIDCDYEKIGRLCNSADEFIKKINNYNGDLVNSYTLSLFEKKYSNTVVQGLFNQLFN